MGSCRPISRHAAVALVVLLALASPALAGPSWLDGQALPCRPTIACTADFVPPGVIEIEAGYIARRLAPSAWQHSTPVLIKFTVAEWLQLQVGSNGGIFATAPVPAAYLDDLTVGAKLHLRNQGRLVPSLSFSATASVPLPAGQPSNLRTWDGLFTLYVTKDIGWLHADLNVGVNVWRLDGTPLPQAMVALALSAPLGRGFGIMLEGYDFTDAAPIDPADAGILAAISYQPRPWLVLDIGGDISLIPSTRSGSAFAGMTIIPVALWDGPARHR